MRIEKFARLAIALSTAAVLSGVVVAVNADDATGNTINLQNKGYAGTVDGFDKASGVVRVKDGAGTVTSYRINKDTTVMKNGSMASADEIHTGDSVTVYLKTITTSNELKRIEIH